MCRDAGTPAPMSDDGPMYAQGEEPGGADPAPGAPAHHQRRVTSFRTRRSQLTGGQQQTWERRWPEVGTEALDAEGRPVPLDPEKWFGRRAPLIVEIGCGTGTSTAAMAQAEPERDVIAVEVYKRGLAQLLSAIDREGITNIRLIRGDGMDVLEHLVPSASLTGVRVFFPDPWPKARHHKRRFIQPASVALIADRLRPGGLLHVATDHQGYAEHIAEVGDAEPTLRRVAMDDELPISVARPETKYERKALAGPIVTELLWQRR